MNTSIFWFSASAIVSLIFLLAMTMMELGGPAMPFKQTGDTTLGRNSINWLSGIAVAAAIYICFFLM